MELKKKWAVNNVPNRLSDNQMKHVVAGYGDGYSDGEDGVGDSSGNACIKCWKTKNNCVVEEYYPPIDCWLKGEADCVYGFACGPCNKLKCE